MRAIIMVFAVLMLVGCPEGASWHKGQPDYSKSYDASRDAFADLEDAERKARSEEKNVLIIVGGEWCSWCHLLNDHLNNNSDVAAALVDNYVVVKVHIGDNGDNSGLLETLPEIKGVPHFFVISPAGRVIASQETGAFEEGRGYGSQKLINFLQQNKYKK